MGWGMEMLEEEQGLGGDISRGSMLGASIQRL